MKHYILCTEWNESLDKVVAQWFDSFFIVKGIGYWHGQAETGCQIHVTTADAATVLNCAEQIKTVFAQQAVLVLDYEVNATYV